MDFKKLLQELDTIAEAGTNTGDPYDSGMYADDDAPTAPGQNPAYDQYVAQMKAQGKNAHYDEFVNQPESDAYKDATKNVPKAPPEQNTSNPNAVADNKPDLNKAPPINVTHSSDTEYTPSTNSQGTDNNQEQSPQELPTGDKNQLIKQLYDVTTQLFNLTKQSIESGAYENVGNIEYALLESFGLLFEGPIGDQRSQLATQATNIIKALSQYQDDPTVANAITKAKEAMNAPKNPGAMYPVDNNKIKRFQELMSKATAAPKTSMQPTTTTKPSAGAATKTSASEMDKKSPKYDPQVEKMQKALQAKGYDLGPRGIDGNLGSATMTAMGKAHISGVSDADIAKIQQNPGTATKTTQPTAQKPPVSPTKPDTGGAGKAAPPSTAPSDPAAPESAKPFKMVSPSLNATDLINYVTKLSPDNQEAIQNYMYDNAGMLSNITMGGPVNTKELEKQRANVIAYINKNKMAPK